MPTSIIKARALRTDLHSAVLFGGENREQRFRQRAFEKIALKIL